MPCSGHLWESAWMSVSRVSSQSFPVSFYSALRFGSGMDLSYSFNPTLTHRFLDSAFTPSCFLLEKKWKSAILLLYEQAKQHITKEAPNKRVQDQEGDIRLFKNWRIEFISRKEKQVNHSKIEKIWEGILGMTYLTVAPVWKTVFWKINSVFAIRINLNALLIKRQKWFRNF